MKSKIKLFFYLVIPALVLFNIASAATASQDRGGGLVGCVDDCQLGDLVLIVIRLVNFLFSLSGLVAMIFIVWSAWNMIQSGGNDEKILAAKTSFSNAIIGLFLVLVVFLLTDAIVGILSGFSLKQMVDFIPHSAPHITP